jgi:hypothetical protein
MVTDAQVRRLKRLSKTEKNQELAAAKAGMDPKTARDYLRDPRLPNERKKDRTWRTRSDPFTQVWDEVREQAATNPGLEAKTLLEALQRKYPGQFADGQVRTLQRRLKQWRATDGPEREVFFAEQHVAGRLGQSDFTRMNELGITIGAQSFPHMLYAVPLRVDVFQLGSGHAVLLGELREPERRIAERALGAGRRAAGTPDRPHVVGGQQRQRRA